MIPASNRGKTFSAAFFLFSLIAVSCSDAGVAPMPELKPLAGVWEARALVVPDPENPPADLDLVAQGASYTLSILSTGQYTTVFDLLLVRGYEAGTISVRDDNITLVPVDPPGTTTSGTWSLEGNILTVEALRELDLDGDGLDEIAFFRIEFVRGDSWERDTARTSMCFT